MNHCLQRSTEFSPKWTIKTHHTTLSLNTWWTVYWTVSKLSSHTIHMSLRTVRWFLTHGPAGILQHQATSSILHVQTLSTWGLLMTRRRKSNAWKMEPGGFIQIPTGSQLQSNMHCATQILRWYFYSNLRNSLEILVSVWQTFQWFYKFISSIKFYNNSNQVFLLKHNVVV